MILIAQGLT